MYKLSLICLLCLSLHRLHFVDLLFCPTCIQSPSMPSVLTQLCRQSPSKHAFCVGSYTDYPPLYYSICLLRMLLNCAVVAS